MSRPRVDTRRRCAERPGRWVLWRVFLALAALALGAASARAEVLVSNLNQDAGTLDKIDFEKREYRTSPNVPGYTQDMKGEYGDESETSPGFTVKYGWNTFPRAFQIETHGSVVTANPPAHGEAVTVSCSVPANNLLQDAAGNEVAALSDQAVSNLTQGPPQPKPLMVRFLEGSVSATHDGINAFQIEFSEEPESGFAGRFPHLARSNETLLVESEGMHLPERCAQVRPVEREGLGDHGFAEAGHVRRQRGATPSASARPGPAATRTRCAPGWSAPRTTSRSRTPGAAALTWPRGSDGQNRESGTRCRSHFWLGIESAFTVSTT